MDVGGGAGVGADVVVGVGAGMDIVTGLGLGWAMGVRVAVSGDAAVEIGVDVSSPQDHKPALLA